jgi:hypothetical protein
MSDTLKKIINAEAALTRMERHLALQKVKQRKAETRRKIELGGLIVKAGLDQYPKSVILGALLDAVALIDQDAKNVDLFKNKGEIAFID